MWNSIRAFFQRDRKEHKHLALPELTRAEQFELLQGELRTSANRGSLGELVMKYFDGQIADARLLFTITAEDYLRWAKALPISSFVSLEPHTFDGNYLVVDSKGWLLYSQERGQRWAEMRFSSESEAHEYIIRHMSPYGVYEHLL